MLTQLNMNKIAIAFIIGVLLGYVIGYSIGYGAALNWAVEKAFWLIEIKGYEIDINKGVILQGLLQYKNHVDGLLPPLNETKIEDHRK